MFQSTLVTYLKHHDVSESICGRIRSELLAHQIRAAVDLGEVRRGLLKSNRRPRGSLPLGTKLISVDICRAERSRTHMKMLPARLQPVLQILSCLGLLDTPQCLEKRLHMTASNGGDDSSFVRTCCFSQTLIDICSEFGVIIVLDVVPYGCQF